MFPQFSGLAIQKIGPETHRIPRRHRPAELGVVRWQRSSAPGRGTRTVHATPGVQCTEMEPEKCHEDVNGSASDSIPRSPVARDLPFPRDRVESVSYAVTFIPQSFRLRVDENSPVMRPSSQSRKRREVMHTSEATKQWIRRCVGVLLGVSFAVTSRRSRPDVRTCAPQPEAGRGRRAAW